MMFLASTFGKIKYFNWFVALTILTNLGGFMNRSLLVIRRQLRNELLKVLIEAVLILAIMLLDEILLQYVIFIEQNVLIRLQIRLIIRRILSVCGILFYQDFYSDCSFWAGKV